MTRVHLSYARGERGLAETVEAALSRARIDVTDLWEVSAPRDWRLGAVRAGDVSRIDFTSMTPHGFTELVADLLRELDFEIDGRHGDAEIDLRATYHRADPFGSPEKQVWLVESKLYAHERVSVETIRQFAGVLSLAPAATQGLLVTNTQLTSVAEEYIDELNRTVNLRVIDGMRLRRLLRELPAVAERHFDGDARVSSDADN